MSDESSPNNPFNLDDFFASLSFPKIFTTFRSAVQPSKLTLALLGVLCFFAGGWVLDSLTPTSSRVTINTPRVVDAPKDHLDAYVRHWENRDTYNDLVAEANESELKKLVRSAGLNLDDDADLNDVKKKYSNNLDRTLEILEDRFNQRKKAIRNTTDDKRQQKRAIEKIHSAYRSLFGAALWGSANLKDINDWNNRLIVEDTSKTGEDRANERENVLDDKKAVRRTARLAKAYHLKKAQDGRGIFATSVGFASQRFGSAVGALVLGDFKSLKNQVVDSIRGVCWIITYHPIFAILLTALTLLTWALFGGAICRIAALQFSRDERLGPIPALKFSLSRLVSFFTAPLVPIAIIAFFALLFLVSGLVAAIPVFGEIITGLLFPLALGVGFIIALIVIRLVAGANLMYPTIAVEGSDSIDAISRSFSYVFTKPWRMAFYTLLALVYGVICYLFVRLFAFLLLKSVRIPLVSMNLDSSSAGGIRGKLDAIWPDPSFGHLHPTINYMALNWSESFAAFLIWFWVVIIVCLVLAFIISFFFSANTTIYFLLRKSVDRTEYEEVFLEENGEELPPLETDETPSDQDETPPDQDETPPESEDTEKEKKPRKTRKKPGAEDSTTDDKEDDKEE
ncbi:MAG: hypothetical protein IID32_08240 [Planctomycetes bacterium]|nr:hypothetical protein [Planctomycetota bacterium]